MDQADADNDDVGDVCDNCVNVANADQLDANMNNTGDACEGGPLFTDGDGDTIVDAIDNCPSLANMAQADTDLDGIGDACDNCDGYANFDQVDSDNDGTGDVCQGPIYMATQDSDGDGVADIMDNCPGESNSGQADDDNDGVGNKCDNCRDVPNYNQADLDTNNIGDACEELPAATPICNNASLQSTRLNPNIYIVIDRSTSMQSKDGTGKSRMERAKEGLDLIAMQLSSDIRIGMSTYPCAAAGQACNSPNKEFLDLGQYTTSQIQASYTTNFTNATCPEGDQIGLDGLDIEKGGQEPDRDRPSTRRRARALPLLRSDGSLRRRAAESCGPRHRRREHRMRYGRMQRTLPGRRRGDLDGC